MIELKDQEYYWALLKDMPNEQPIVVQYNHDIIGDEDFSWFNGIGEQAEYRPHRLEIISHIERPTMRIV
jgi:hypothetical protein